MKLEIKNERLRAFLHFDYVDLVFFVTFLLAFTGVMGTPLAPLVVFILATYLLAFLFKLFIFYCQRTFVGERINIAAFLLASHFLLLLVLFVLQHAITVSYDFSQLLDLTSTRSNIYYPLGILCVWALIYKDRLKAKDTLSMP